jgi:Putative DNA-binding domain
MDLSDEVKSLIGQPESSTLEYKAVLPPSRTIALLISSFANAEGGFIILGVADNLEINGLSKDFHANAIIHKALDILLPQPIIQYQYVAFKDKNLYAIKVQKSPVTISLEGKIFKRVGVSSRLQNLIESSFRKNGFAKIQEINHKITILRSSSTGSGAKLFDHYSSVLKILDDLGQLLYPNDPQIVSSTLEGRILSRILFSSFVDTFETFLSDLLYEIFLAIPSTLKSNETVTIEEVLNCSDLQEFIKYCSNKKIYKLQKGSVKGFLKETKQIRDLEAIDKPTQEEIERILQIRHLYAHRNGIVDEKFLQYFHTGFTLNDEHALSVDEICDKLVYLAEIVKKIDEKAAVKYRLSVGE